jgi:hypothetical protein
VNWPPVAAHIGYSVEDAALSFDFFKDMLQLEDDKGDGVRLLACAKSLVSAILHQGSGPLQVCLSLGAWSLIDKMEMIVNNKTAGLLLHVYKSTTSH